MASAKNNASHAIDNLANHLPTGTVLIFQILSPLFSNDGECGGFNRLMMGLLIGMCSIFCVIACFTDSYIGDDGIVHYCWVCPSGLKPSEKGIELPFDIDINNSEHGISIGDVVHAVMSALLFFSVTLLDQNTVSCFYSGLEEKHKQVLSVIPVGIGALCSAIFVIYPTRRRGIGYSTSSSTENKRGEEHTKSSPHRPELNPPASKIEF